MRFLPIAAACAALLTAGPAAAVRLNPDGLGQALIYPYYTARTSASGQFFQTLVTVVNHTAGAKSLRVRFREGANGLSVGEFNLFLGPRDMWTGAVVRSGSSDAALLLSNDSSCVDPPIPAAGRVFTAGSLEGFIEVIEMATLSGVSVAAVTPGPQGMPPGCASVSAPQAPEVAPPTGGLSGTLTIIDVQRGFDFTVNAEALAELTTQSFHRAPVDSYPGFGAVEVTPVSIVTANGQIYRSLWSNGREAVSATLLRLRAMGEFTVESATQSRTDFIVTFPTRPYYPAAGAATPPFWTTGAPPYGNRAFASYLDRASYSNFSLGCVDPESGFPEGGLVCNDPPDWDRASSVFTVTNGSAHAVTGSPGIFLSTTPKANAAVRSQTDHGWFSFSRAFQDLTTASVTSLPDSTRLDIATGQSVTGSHRFRGMPQVGFAARTFVNGTLPCSAGTCQGNYGSAFPFSYRYDISGP